MFALSFRSSPQAIRAITTPDLWHGAYWIIIAGEAFLTFILVLIGGLPL